MSSIEKALERLIAKNEKRDSSKDGYASINEMSPEELEEEAAENGVLGDADKTRQFAQDKDPGARKKIVHLDYEKLAAAGYLTPDVSNNKLSEEYRIIKRPILVNAYNKGAEILEHGNLVMVTSALPGEGKTYTTINLAISIAMELDSTVLLVDGDIITASLSQFLGVGDEPGLMELLDPNEDSYQLQDVLISTDLPKMKILPAGRLIKNPTELLSSVKMKNLMEELSDRYGNRIILFDAPPILATTEASSLMDHMGQIIFVVEAGKTANESITSAIDKINHEKVIGIVLNKSRFARKGEYYGGYYGSRQTDNQVVNEE